jgi:hypothetical protein
LILVAASFLVAGLALLFLRHEAAPSLPPQAHVSPASSVASSQQAAAPLSTSSSGLNGSRFRGIKDFLRSASDAAIARQDLAGLRAELASMPKEAAVSAIRQYLDSKADATTHLGFKVGGGGWLDEAPTLRTFLLDELARLDPAAAADYARVILGGMDSPDEWAVALRDLAAGDSSADGRALLEQKTAQMLQYAPWQQNPSAGYLEAFDVAVYLGGTNLLPALSGLVRQQDNPALAHASYLAMDRLVINNPATELAALEAAPELMQGREATRADFFARADVGDPQQRQVLESYLLNPAIAQSELQTFAGVYPNANYMISLNLLTPTPTPGREALVSRDAQSLAVAQQWLADPRFAGLGPVLQRIVSRLQMFVQQASQGP